MKCLIKLFTNVTHIASSIYYKPHIFIYIYKVNININHYNLLIIMLLSAYKYIIVYLYYINYSSYNN